MIKIVSQSNENNERIYFDTRYNFYELFNSGTGFYARSSVIENKKESNIDPFMRSFPALIDVGIMAKCANANLCPVQCYQGRHKNVPNMSLQNFKKIVDEVKNKTQQLALGGCGSPNEHEQFEEIVKYAFENNVVPNYTTSGIGLTEDMVNITKKYCGAVAVSWYKQDFTYSAIERFVNAGIPTNIHYVLGNDSIDEAILHLKNNDFPKGIKAVIFLLHKPVGLGSMENVLKYEDKRLIDFFKLVDNNQCDFQIGFDSCTIPAILNFTKNIIRASIDTCEAGRYSMYITPDMQAIPCSFDNQDLKYAIDLNKFTIQQAWDSDKFDEFREYFKRSCLSCKDNNSCYGGCPLKREIVLCQREEINLK